MSARGWRRTALAMLVGFVLATAASVGAVVGVVDLEDKKGTVKIVHSDLPGVAIADPGFVQVSDMTTTIETKKAGLLLMRFSAAAQCQEGNAGGCIGRVRIKVDPSVDPSDNDAFIAEPDTGEAFLANAGAEGFHALSIERAVDDLPADTYVITVEGEVAVSDDILLLRDRQLTVQAFK